MGFLLSRNKQECPPIYTNRLSKLSTALFNLFSTNFVYTYANTIVTINVIAKMTLTSINERENASAMRHVIMYKTIM